MQTFYELPHFGFDATSGFARAVLSDDILSKQITCSGTDLFGAAQILPAFYSALDIRRIKVTADYVDASNFGIKIPSGLNPDFEFRIFASATSFPSSGNVVVFLNNGETFVDGSDSLTIPAGMGRTLRIIAANSGSPVWGYE